MGDTLVQKKKAQLGPRNGWKIPATHSRGEENAKKDKWFQFHACPPSPAYSQMGRSCQGFRKGVFVRGGGNLNNWGGARTGCNN